MVGPKGASCGTAAYRREPVYVTDILSDPLWDGYRHLLSLIAFVRCGRDRWSRSKVRFSEHSLSFIEKSAALLPPDLQLIENPSHIARSPLSVTSAKRSCGLNATGCAWFWRLPTACRYNFGALRRLIEVLSSSLLGVTRCDFCALLLPDADSGELRATILYNPDARGSLCDGAIVPIHSSACGKAFRTGKTQHFDLGITGTPVIDAPSQTLYLDAMIAEPAGARHLIFALSLQNGATLPGWPVDVMTALAARGEHFDGPDQNQRGALTIVGGRVYIPYGGHFGDCGDYHGWVVGIGVNNPRDIVSWHTRARGGGIWAPAGVASDGRWLYVSTGNTFGARQWSDGEAVFKLAPTSRAMTDRNISLRQWIGVTSTPATRISVVSARCCCEPQ